MHIEKRVMIEEIVLKGGCYISGIPRYGLKWIIMVFKLH